MIYGYSDRPSALPGSTISFHVSTSEDDAPFHIEFYRQGQQLDYIDRSDRLLGYRFRGAHLPEGTPDCDWQWPGYDVAIPESWRSGVYIARFVEGDGEPVRLPSTYSDHATALFVVRSPAPGRSAPILYKLATNTYQAYNHSGGGTLYEGQRWSWSDTPPGYKVTLLRRGGGTGAIIRPTEPVDEDIYDHVTHSPRQTFAHWDALFIGWLEQHGYRVDYCCDLDVDTYPEILQAYPLLLCAGHDEYWSDGMRGNVEAFIRSGGNVAIFSGNTCWWRIHYTDYRTNRHTGELLATALTCDKVSGLDQWWTTNPENGLTGVSYRNGGGHWSGPRQQLGYTIQQSDHWVFQDTGLQDGDRLGYESYLVGYECDGAYYTTDQMGRAVATGSDGTPASYLILGTAVLDESWQELPPREIEQRGPHAATLGVYTTDGGTVFNAGTIDWARVLASGNDRAVEQVTRNVLNRLGHSRVV